MICNEFFLQVNKEVEACFTCEVMLLGSPNCLKCDQPNFKCDLFCNPCAQTMRNKCWDCGEDFRSANYSDHLCNYCAETRGQKRRCRSCSTAFYSGGRSDFICYRCQHPIPEGYYLGIPEADQKEIANLEGKKLIVQRCDLCWLFFALTDEECKEQHFYTCHTCIKKKAFLDKSVAKIKAEASCSSTKKDQNAQIHDDK